MGSQAIRSREIKDLPFELKEVGDDGTFEGVLMVYGIKDLGGDIIEAGAAKKSISDNGGKFPMLWQHDPKLPIGEIEVLGDNEAGLLVRGRFILEVKQAQEAYLLVKARVVRGLSIGFRAVKKQFTDGIRYLKEIQLFEGSVVTFPMMPLAQITDVKAGEQKADFAEEFERAQAISARWMMYCALGDALDSIVYSKDMQDEDQIAAADASIQQFRAAYIEYLPRYFAALRAIGMKTEEAKAGRRVSAATRSVLEEAISKLSALLTDQAADTSDDDPKAVKHSIPEAAATPTPEDKRLSAATLLRLRLNLPLHDPKGIESHHG